MNRNMMRKAKISITWIATAVIGVFRSSRYHKSHNMCWFSRSGIGKTLEIIQDFQNSVPPSTGYRIILFFVHGDVRFVV
jgi:hypothetical protein